MFKQFGQLDWVVKDGVQLRGWNQRESLVGRGEDCVWSTYDL